MTSESWRKTAPLLLTLLSALGCGQNDYEVAEVSGVATLDGQPLDGCRLMFAPVATAGKAKAGKVGFADIRADGSYTVSTYGNEDGAVVADHWVSVINLNPESPTGKRLGAERVKFPKRLTVSAGENKLPLDFTTEMVKRFGAWN